MKNSHRFSLVITILLLTGIAGYRMYFFTQEPSDQSTPVSDFPTVIGEWASEDITVSQRVYDLLETRNLIMRDYKNANGEKILLYIIYSPDNRKVSHPPEICLEGDGATITKKMPVEITSQITATGLILEKAKTRDYVVFWYRIGTQNTYSYVRQQINIMLDVFRKQRHSVAFIRLMTNIGNDTPEIAVERIKSFCVLIAPLLDTYLP